MITAAYFKNDPFAEGRFQYAYKGTWTENTSKPGQQCVVKKFKNIYTWEISNWDTTVKAHGKAQQLARDFKNKLQFVEVQVLKAQVPVHVLYENARCVKNDEYIVAEDYLEGSFNKWCNNYGYVSQEALGVDNILTAFMHWTWVYSGGEEMVGDIQGVKTHRGEYKLTDPAIMSTTNKYGPTDTGVEGMAMFFLTHKCTPICSGLARPTLAQFIGKIPEHMILELQNFSRRGTTYTHEMKFTADVKKLLVAAFVSIATGKQ